MEHIGPVATLSISRGRSRNLAAAGVDVPSIVSYFVLHSRFFNQHYWDISFLYFKKFPVPKKKKKGVQAPKVSLEGRMNCLMLLKEGIIDATLDSWSLSFSDETWSIAFDMQELFQLHLQIYIPFWKEKRSFDTRYDFRKTKYCIWFREYVHERLALRVCPWKVGFVVQDRKIRLFFIVAYKNTL